jgi:hypothetical protein
MTAATAPSAVAYSQSPFLYINGIVISNDATTPNTKVDVSAGMCRDSTDVYYMNLGNFNGFLNGSITPNSSTIIDATINGAGGLDTGSLGASKVYFVYVIADPINANPTTCMLSLTSTSAGGPLMPTGYSIYRHVGYIVTDASSHFLLSYNAGNNNARIFMYDAPISVGTTASSASYAAINLTKFVPLVNNLPVWLNASISGTAADTLSLQPGNAIGAAVVITAAVSSQALQQQVLVFAQNTTISTVLSPTINYKNSGTDTIAVLVGGFNYYI